MDGTGDFYAETYRMYSLFLRLAKGLLVTGADAIAVDLLARFRRNALIQGLPRHIGAVEKFAQ